MFILTCSIFDHQLSFLTLALIICASGAFVTVSLYVRCQSMEGAARVGWLILTSICAGATTWTTHFVAMLGYHADIPATFDPLITILSIVVAICGAGLGFGLASYQRSQLANAIGGGMVGLSIAAMHYLGMLGYHIDGFIRWNGAAVAWSVAAAAALSATMLVCLIRDGDIWQRIAAMVFFALSILTLHLLGMQALTLYPLGGTVTGYQDTAPGMALAVAVVALLIIGAGLSTCFIDLERRVQSSQSWLDMAFHDALTGLPNRRAFKERIDAAFAAQTWFKLLLIDLDHFKSVNDTFGHLMGDKLLCEVARRMLDVVGPDAYAFRLGGDELAVLIFQDRVTAMQTALDLVHRLQQPLEIDGRRIVTGCSIGLCAFEHANDGDTLMQHADRALYEAKRRGRAQVFRYTHGMLEADVLRSQLECDLQSAVEKGQLRLVFQPILDLATLQVRGYEALLRWSHPTRGDIPPGTFVPIAEDSGLITAIGKWVVEEACRAAAAWPNEAYIAVNVSALQLRTTRFAAQVVNALAESGLPAHRLVLELTETALIADGDEVARLLEAIRSLGVRIAMDDFGTGYSSLSHLRRLPVDCIKIDRSFVTSAIEDRNAMAVLRAIIQIGRDMGIGTIGEGVETPEQAQVLRDIGCEAAQGYLFGRPGAVDAGEPLQLAS